MTAANAWMTLLGTEPAPKRQGKYVGCAEKKLTARA